MFKLTQRPFHNLSIESRELITLETQTKAVPVGRVSQESSTRIEKQTSRIETHSLSILDSILDSCEDRESSVNLLLNGTFFLGQCLQVGEK